VATEYTFFKDRCDDTLNLRTSDTPYVDDLKLCESQTPDMTLTTHVNTRADASGAPLLSLI
jgi:hypothetical protein